MIQKQTTLIRETLAAVQSLAQFVEKSPWEKKQRPMVRKLLETAAQIVFTPALDATAGLQNLLTAVSPDCDPAELMDALDSTLAGRLNRFVIRGCLEGCRKTLQLGCTLIHELRYNDLTLYAITFPSRHTECNAWLNAIKQLKEDDLRRGLLSFMEEHAQSLMEDRRQELQTALEKLNERFEWLRDRCLPEMLDSLELSELLTEGGTEIADEDERAELTAIFGLQWDKLSQTELKALCDPEAAPQKHQKPTKAAMAELQKRNLNHCCERACLWAQIARLDAQAERRALAHLAETQYRRAIYSLRTAKETP